MRKEAENKLRGIKEDGYDKRKVIYNKKQI